MQRSAGNAFSTILKFLSDTSRMHVMVVHGDDVFDALCTLEQRDVKGMEQAIRLQEDSSRDVPIRVRTFGEYALTLVVLEWPLHPSEKTTSSLLVGLQTVLTGAIRDKRQVDGLTLVANELAVSRDLNFRSCFVKIFEALEYLGHHPRAIVQQCHEDTSETAPLPFDAEYFGSNFFTRLSLHHLLAKK